jgi:hypothetical protein
VTVSSQSLDIKAKAIGLIRAHKHVISRVTITFSLIAFGALWLSWCGPVRCLLVYALLVMLFAAQLFWNRRVLDIGERFIPGHVVDEYLEGSETTGDAGTWSTSF